MTRHAAGVRGRLSLFYIFVLVTKLVYVMQYLLSPDVLFK